MTKSTLILVRHAATAVNALRPPRLQGQKQDNLLSEIGERQSAALSRALQDYAISAVYSSPLQRARQTAQAIAQPRGLIIESLDGMREIDIGLWEGKTWPEIEAGWPQEFAAFQADSSVQSYLGGETLAELCDRTLKSLVAPALKHDNQVWVVVGHNVVNRTLLANWMKIPLRYGRQLPQSNAGFSIIHWKDANAKVACINQSSHLSGLLEYE